MEGSCIITPRRPPQAELIEGPATPVTVDKTERVTAGKFFGLQLNFHIFPVVYFLPCAKYRNPLRSQVGIYFSTVSFPPSSNKLPGRA